MKSSMDHFLSPTDRQRIIDTVKAVERTTAGEIVPFVVPASYHYPVGVMIGAAAIAFPAALLGTHFLGGFFWLGADNLWLFLGMLCVLFWAGHAAVRRMPALRRIFVSEREMEEEVWEAAFVNFYKRGLHLTRDHAGVLIFISVFERKVVILADRGVNAKVSQDQWDGTVKDLVSGIRNNQVAEAICRSVEDVARLLATHFPPKPDDTDELSNLIVEK
ncbi:MAG: hypothetical protein SWC96_00430 [Thermodesulfobacteriota bacterium]|nr:hypothetical protein [Thermodesulfobacteriota bacterium]